MTLADTPPLPVPTVMSADFWAAARRHEFALPRCARCRQYVHLPAVRCPHCGSDSMPVEVLSGRATIYTFAIVSRAFHPYFEARLPYAVGSVIPVEDPRARFFTRFVDVDPEELVIGLPVEVTFEKLSETVTLPLFRPEPGVEKHGQEKRDK